MGKGYFVIYLLFLASLMLPVLGIPLTLLIFFIVIVGVIALSNSSESKSGNENKNKETGDGNELEKPASISLIQNENKKTEKSTLDRVKQNAPSEEEKKSEKEKTKSEEQKKPKYSTVEKAPEQSAEHEFEKTTVSKKTESENNTLIHEALSLYDNCSEVVKDKIDIDQVLTKTQKDEIVWIEGENNRVVAWAANYQDGLLVLYKDLVKKKYKFIFFQEKSGFLQRLTKITELRKAIEVQIANRKVEKDTIPSTGFLVRTNMFKCIRNHGIEDIIAVIRLLNTKGTIVQVEVPAARCDKCKVYYIHEHIFQKILTYGTPLCQVITEKQYLSGAYLNMNQGMAQKSLLKICGYSVSAAEGLTDQERQKILESIIENGIMTRHEIIQYLNYFISMRKNQSRDMSEAISKWKRDVHFVENMRISGLSRYEVKTVYRIDR